MDEIMQNDDTIIKSLIEQSEGETLEFKQYEKLESINDKGKKDLAKLFAALANNKGGLILFGVADNRKFDEYKLTEDKFKEFKQKLIQIANSNCKPSIYLNNIRLLNVEKHKVLLVEVPARKSLPHAVKGKFYIRIEDQNIELTDPTKIRELIEEKKEPKQEKIVEDKNIKKYLNKIIYGDKISEIYTELKLDLEPPINDIFPQTLRLEEVEDNSQLDFEVLEIVGKEKNLIISGASGSGKTTSLKWLNVTLAKKYLIEDDFIVPIYIELNSYIGGSFFNYVMIKAKEKGLSKQTLDSLLDGKAIFLIDGLDLLSSSNVFEPYNEISNFISSYSDCRYVITSRPSFFEGFRNQFTISELEELNDEKICSFIEKYVRNDKLAESIKNNILNNEALKSLFRNPMMLYLGIKVTTVRGNSVDGNFHVDFPSNRAKMYEAFIENLFSHYTKKGKRLHADRLQVEETLFDIYFKLQCKNKVACKYRRAIEIAKKHSIDVKFNKTTAQYILDDIFKLGLLFKDGTNIQYGIHQSFQEYFVALKLINCFKSGMDISQVFGHPKWENIIILCSEMLDCPDDFITLAITNNELYLASKCAKNASLQMKEELCTLFADRLDSKFEFDKIKSIRSIGRLGDVGISLLIEVLRDENANLRKSSAYALGRIKSDEAVEPLIGAMYDKDIDVRWSVAYALGEINSKTAVKPLINALSDENNNIQTSALYALGKMKSDMVVESLIEALRDQDNNIKRSRAAQALGMIKSDKAIEPLISALYDRNFRVRRKAANALGQIKSDEAIPPLIEAFRDEDNYVRKGAANSLVIIKSDKVVESLIDAVKDQDEHVRRRAAGALGRIKSDEAIEPLIEALRDQNHFVRKGASNALGKIESDKTVELLIEALRDKDQFVRGNAANALGQIKSDKIVEPLIDLLRDKNKNVRRIAARVFGSIKSDEAVEPLIDLLEDENKYVRQGAANALGQIKSDKAVEPLIDALKDKNEFVRRKAANALGQIKSDKTIEPLIKSLQDNDSEVKLIAIYALSQMKSNKSVDSLIELLHDEKNFIRCRAAYALGEIKSDKSVEPLIDALNDNDDSVRRSVTNALSKIKSDKSVERIIDILHHGKDVERSRASYVLGEIKSDRVIEPLIDALNDNDDGVRRSAIIALSNIKSDEVIEPLIDALKDNDDSVRRNAIGALSNIKSDKAVELLIETLNDEKEIVRTLAFSTLKMICTVREKEQLEKIKDSSNIYAANKAFEILMEIEQTEKSKIELFKKEVGVLPVFISKNKNKIGGAHPAEEGIVDPYIGMFIDRLKSITKPISIIDYGCGEGKLLCAMKSLPETTLGKISYIGVDIRTGYLFKTRLNAKKYGLCKLLRTKPEFIKPKDFFSKKIVADYILMVHTLHEIKLVDFIDITYHFSAKLNVGGRIFILDQRKLLEKERSFVLWDRDDLKIIFSNSGLEPYWRPIDTKSGNKLSSIEIEKVKDNCFPKERVADNCLSAYQFKKEMISKKLSNNGLNDGDFKFLTFLYSNISIQIDEYNNTVK